MAAEKILIVDDEEGMRRLLGRVLTKEGYETTSVGSGAEALQYLGGDQFDLVITDIQMPGMNGLELLRDRITSYNVCYTKLLRKKPGEPERATVEIRSKAGAFSFVVGR